MQRAEHQRGGLIQGIVRAMAEMQPGGLKTARRVTNKINDRQQALGMFCHPGSLPSPERLCADASLGIMADMTHTKHLLRLLSIMLLAGVVGAAAVFFWPEPEPAEMVGTVFPEPRTLPDVSLTNHSGADWGVSDLRDGWSFVFFGFTHCPDVCPMTLATLAGTLSRIEQTETKALPEVVFVSVDPGRDSPAQLATYVQHFHDDFIGVTGEREAIDTFTRGLGIAYSLGEPDDNGDYAVDHSAAILLINPDGRLQALWQPPHGRDVLADEFLRIKNAYEGARI